MQEKEKKHLDTYFFSSKKALEIASKQNRVETSVKVVDALQVCYYAGEKKLLDAPKNCIHVPLENVYNYFVNSITRFPKAISFEDTDLSIVEQAQLNQAFSEILNEANNERGKLISVLVDNIAEQSEDYNEKPYKVFIPACRETTVMQYVAKNIADAFEDLGCEVYYHIQDELSDCSTLSMLVALYNFNPHFIVNINHLNNQYLHKDRFNFSWFQDHMPILYNEEKIQLRERDYIFYLIDMFKNCLLNKNVPENKLIKQSFATNPKIFYRDESIKKENKIVFLGSDYNFEENSQIDDECKEEVYSNIDNNTLTNDIIKKLIYKYGLDEEEFDAWIVASLVRRRIILWLCSIKNINIEIYGTDTWLNNPEVTPFYKGLLPYGKEMAKVYNSAKYAIAVHPHYMYQQRLIEMSACDTIPLVYQGHLIREDFYHKDNVLTFNTLKELKECVGKIPQKSCTQIAEDISYKKMALSIINTVEQQIKG